MFLLDTMVLSELRKAPCHRNRQVGAWIAAVRSDEVFLSVITLAEIERGIERQRQVNPPFAAALEAWLDLTRSSYADHILPLTTAIARRWGRLACRIGNKGLDLAIAATALEHGLTVVTRNVADFQPAGVAIFNPWGDALP